jgi:glycine/D-amino acid oxidase-like deaminating enzyme
MKVPAQVRYCVIGGGVHGLSVAWHLARQLHSSGRGDGSEILLLEKSQAGAGASGIACGVVRNYYFAPAMCELVKLSIDVWEEDPEAFAYRPAGYIAAVPRSQVGDLEAIYRRQQEIGYPSELILGEAACSRHMKKLFADFHCEGIEGVLHEKVGGFATPVKTIAALARKAEECGVRICSGVEVTGFDLQGGEVQSIRTSQGTIRPELVVVAAGPWSGRFL